MKDKLKRTPPYVIWGDHESARALPVEAPAERDDAGSGNVVSSSELTVITPKPLP